MTPIPSPLAVLAVRSVHVLAMAVLFGGAVLCWGVLRSDGVRDRPGSTIRTLATYEWLFWTGVGLLVLTGVGNLGAFAPAIPGWETAWGTTFSVKALGVVGLLLGSLVRTAGVLRLLVRAPKRLPSELGDRLRRGYGATAAYLLLVVVLAEVLAHG